MSKRRPTDREFQQLTAQINQTIIDNDGLIGDQKDQVELLLQLESKFKFTICKYTQAVDVYGKFIDFIVNENGNILSARPYFREKGATFSKGITKAIRERDPVALMEYDINYQLINFIVTNWKGKLPERPKRYYEDFLEARRILLENNLPLAINRAKLFYRKTPRSHLTLLDLIDISTYGLVSGVDKYCGAYSRANWANVCIGRMVGYMIEEYSKTFIRMYPSDKKILYRANSLKHSLKLTDIVELTKAVNESFEKDAIEGKKNLPKLPISEVHVRTLLNGSSYISADTKSGSDDDDDGISVYDYTQDVKVENPEKLLIKQEILAKISVAMKELSIIERKIIKLKGVDL